MSMSDPIGDMLTRIRNASTATKPTVDVPASGLKVELAKMLQKFGFIRKFVVLGDNKQGVMKILLKYVDDEPAIQGLERVSRPGLRRYSGAATMPKVLNGLGYSIISTSSGLKTDHECRSENTGGEILCKVW